MKARFQLLSAMTNISRFLGGVDVENPAFTNLFIDENFDTPSERHHIIMSSFNSSPVVEDDMFGFYQIGKLFNCMNCNYYRVIPCYYRPQGKVMFSEAFVSHSVHREGGLPVCFQEGLHPGGGV